MRKRLIKQDNGSYGLIYGELEVVGVTKKYDISHLNRKEINNLRANLNKVTLKTKGGRITVEAGKQKFRLKGSKHDK